MVVQGEMFMAEIRNSNRSPSVGEIADFLLYGKSGLNKYEIKKWVPLLGGTGLGDLFMGQAPELMDDTSYYGLNALLNGGNRASGGLGTLQPKRETFDAAMLGMDATGLASLTAKMGGNLSKAALNKMAIEAGNLSRRKFLKGSAAVAGGAALGGLMKLGKETGEQVAKHSTDNVAAKVAKEAPKKYKYNSLKEYSDGVKNYVNTNIDNLSGYGDTKEQIMKEILLGDEQLYTSMKAGEAHGFDNQQIEEILNEFSPQAKAEMKHFKDKVYPDLSYEHASAKYSDSLYNEPLDYDRLVEKEIDNDQWINYLDDYVNRNNYYK